MIRDYKFQENIVQDLFDEYYQKLEKKYLKTLKNIFFFSHFLQNQRKKLQDYKIHDFCNLCDKALNETVLFQIIPKNQH